MKGPEAPCSPGSLYGTNIIILRRANKDHQLAIVKIHGYFSKDMSRWTVRRRSTSIEWGDIAGRNRDSSAPTVEEAYNPLRDIGEPCTLNEAGQSHCRVRSGRVPRS